MDESRNKPQHEPWNKDKLVGQKAPFKLKEIWAINAAVVGLLLAALYQPVWTSAIHAPQDFGLALVALVALMFWKLPPWLVVVGSGFAGW